MAFVAATGKRAGRMVVASELLIQCLHIPVDTRIRGARFVEDGIGGGDVELVIEHIDLRELQEGEPLPRTDAQLKRQSEIEFTGWRQY